VDEILAGRYELIRSLGAGGNAEVFEAVDRHLERRVAVKRARLDAADPAAAERLTREARAAARVVHPNVVRVYDAGTDAIGRPFVVVELVEGPSLAAVLADRGPLALDEALRIVDEVLAGLGAVHAEGIVHRDVKPANVLLTAGGVAKLADFGIARALGSTTSLTATGQVIGTAAYLSPEQATGHAATPRSDLYAVGVLLYEVLTGSTPFARDGPAAMAQSHRDGTVPLHAVREADLPAAVIDILGRCLSKDPGQRPTDASALRAALTGADATGALPPTTSDPGPAPVPPPDPDPARRRWPVVAAVGALLALLIGVAAGARSGDGGAVAATTTGPTTTIATTIAVASPPPTTVVEKHRDDEHGHGNDEDRGHGGHGED
jgi:eukaryotic-like serine/threonine-protein kinase